VNVEGLGSLGAEPDPPPRNSGGMKPSTVAGSGPNTRNPAGGADGVWVGSVGGSLPKLAIGQRRSGGVLAQLAINHLVARRRERFRRCSHFPSAPSTHLRSAEPGHRRATYSVASGQRKKWTLLWLQHGRREALASWLIRGLSLGCYSAPRRRVAWLWSASRYYLSGGKRCNDFGPSL
jgi:hypothetical protein